MTTITKESSTLAWLKGLLAEHRDSVICLVRRLTSFGAPDGMESSTFRKFVTTLQEIALEKEAENEILTRIEGIEQRHSLQRRCGKLKAARNRPLHEKNPKAAFGMQAEIPVHGWGQFLKILGFMGASGMNSDKRCMPD